MDMLQLHCPAPSQLGVEMLPRRAKRLVQRRGFFLQALEVRTGEPREQVFVKRVAIRGDLRQERGERGRRIVRLRTVAAGARGHQDRAGQDCRGFEEQFLARQVLHGFHTLPERFERDLLQYKPPVAPLVVEMVRVPLAEMVVGPLVHRVIEIVSPGVDRQLVEQVRIEPRRFQDRRIGGAQQIERERDHVVIAAGANARPGDIPRNRAHPFVRIRLDALVVIQHRHGPVAKIIVEPRERCRPRSARSRPKALLRPGSPRPRAR